MGIFGKKKQECDCGGACAPKVEETVATACDCGGACDASAKNTSSNILVLGSGCKKCNQLEDATKEALKELGRTDEVGHITDFTQIAAYGVMSTPALVIDGKVVSTGKVLKPKDIVKLLDK